MPWQGNSVHLLPEKKGERSRALEWLLCPKGYGRASSGVAARLLLGEGDQDFCQLELCHLLERGDIWVPEGHEYEVA